MDTVSVVSLAVIVAFALVAGVIDIRVFKIPNLLTLPLLVSGVLFHGVVSGWPGVQSSLIGALCGFGLIFLMYVLGAMGAGDVKFMAAVGAWLGMPATLEVFAVAAGATAAYSVALLSWEGGLRRVAVAFQIMFVQLVALGKYIGTEERIEQVAQASDRRKRLVPFGAMIALGAIAVVIWHSFAR